MYVNDQAGKTLRARLALCAVLLALSLLGTSTASASVPAVDEYTPQVPNARGNDNLAAKPPVARPQTLPAPTAEALAEDPEDKPLAAAATATELGSPAVADHRGGVGVGGDFVSVGGDDPSFVAAAGHVVDSGPTIALLLGIVALVALFVVPRWRAGSR